MVTFSFLSEKLLAIVLVTLYFLCRDASLEKSDTPLTAADLKYRRKYKDHAYVVDQVC